MMIDTLVGYINNDLIDPAEGVAEILEEVCIALDISTDAQDLQGAIEGCVSADAHDEALSAKSLEIENLESTLDDVRRALSSTAEEEDDYAEVAREVEKQRDLASRLVLSIDDARDYLAQMRDSDDEAERKQLLDQVIEMMGADLA